MDRLVIVPHFDDAVLSLGDHLNLWARTESVHVATAFGGVPRKPVSTTFDQGSGFADSTQARNARWLENQEALHQLGVYSISAGDFRDAQYGESPDEKDVRRWVEGLVEMMEPKHVIATLGLHHADHKMLGDAVFGLTTHVAEDLPYRVLFPLEVLDALELIPVGELVSEVPYSEVKEMAVRRYGSQLWSLSVPTVLCPERLWSTTG